MVPKNKNINIVPFVSVDNIMKIICTVGLENFLSGLATYIEEDMRRWEVFHKTPRVASHSDVGVIELMPISDDKTYSFKYVNGHPGNIREGLQTIAAFGLLADVSSGYPVLLSEMTMLTALRTAAFSALAAKYLAPKDADVMAIIGNGAQSEFQALAFRNILGINRLKLYDIDRDCSQKFVTNMEPFGFSMRVCNSPESAVEGADIITTITADKQYATILTDNMVGAGVHISAMGGDCPGKTEIHKDVLLRSQIFTEYTPQTRIEGEIQQLPNDHQVTELHEVISGKKPGRKSQEQITLFDSVGFAIADFSALRYLRDQVMKTGIYEQLDLLADPDDPRDLFGMLMRSAGAVLSKE